MLNLVDEHPDSPLPTWGALFLVDFRGLRVRPSSMFGINESQLKKYFSGKILP